MDGLRRYRIVDAHGTTVGWVDAPDVADAARQFLASETGRDLEARDIRAEPDGAR